MQKKVVITGGPGTGKSSVISSLQELKYTCMSEVSRKVTRDAQDRGVDQLFLKDPLKFSELLLQGRINQYTDSDIHGGSAVFFDRGIPDVLGYLDYVKVSYPDFFKEACLQYKYHKIFMMPPWKEIYKTDNERYESFEQSLLIYENLKKTYSGIGYDFQVIPEGTIQDRVDYILNALAL